MLPLISSFLLFTSVLSSPIRNEENNLRTAAERERDVEVALTLIPIAFLLFATVVAVSALTTLRRKQNIEEMKKEKYKKAFLDSSSYGSFRIRSSSDTKLHSPINQRNAPDESSTLHSHCTKLQNKSLMPFTFHPVY